MKKLLIPITILLVLLPIEKAFSLFGFGVYGISDPISVSGYQEGDLNMDFYQFNRDGFDGALGGGIFLYLDFIPIVDIEASFETGINQYRFQFENIASPDKLESDFGWARISGYLTVRKRVVGFGVPILGGIRLNVGGGLNFHKSAPLASVDMVQSLISGGLTGEFDKSNLEDQMVDFIDKNSTESNGIHFQIGAQIKLLTLNTFLTYRYTIAKDVVPETDNFSSLLLGIGIGL